jgi:c-di-GMP-binding flagellar brake protein YcgR
MMSESATPNQSAGSTRLNRIGEMAGTAEDCLLRTTLEVLFVLRALKQQKALVALYFDTGERYIVSSVLDVDARRARIVLQHTPDADLNARVLAARALTFVSALSDVKVQFECERVEETRFENAAAFAVPVPRVLLRIQRRAYFRISTPAAHPPRCIVPFEDLSGARAAEVPILDISCGGVGVADQHYAFHFEPGAILENCRIALPEIGELPVTLHVVNTFSVTLDDGITCIRAGCEFARMAEYQTSIVQRYVLDLERARNARTPRGS